MFVFTLFSVDFGIFKSTSMLIAYLRALLAAVAFVHCIKEFRMYWYFWGMAMDFSAMRGCIACLQLQTCCFRLKPAGFQNVRVFRPCLSNVSIKIFLKNVVFFVES